ncbi:MAG: rhomboid family intramembrane serine protease [Oscillospiraceae bacterium]|nr:rhomboid family intramembrane serine protease [Oscillospiraceae bacterium]
MKRKSGGIYLNSPVILGLTFTSAVVLFGDIMTFGALNSLLISRFTSWLDPLMYLRFFTRVLAHADVNHYFGNFMLILVVGPMMEERYGEKRLLTMLLITAFMTGLCNAIFFPQYATIGASGLAFMLILLSSFVNMKNAGLPLTMLLVGFFYIGNEIIGGLFRNDNISQFSHIIGGLCGAVFGFYFRSEGQASRL